MSAQALDNDLTEIIKDGSRSKQKGSRQMPKPKASETPSASPAPSMTYPSPRGSAKGQVTSDVLAIYAGALDELESTRIANENRVRSLEAFGIEGPELERLKVLVEAIRALEKGAELELKRALRKHPLGPWVKNAIGVGEKQGARLIAAIGDPADRRTVSQLWAYCGYHVLNPTHATFDAHCSAGGVQEATRDGVPIAHSTCDEVHGVAPKRRKGERANWSAEAKMRAHLVAVSCIKKNGKIGPRSPYRDIYDEARAKYEGGVHHHNCNQCGLCGSCGNPPGKNRVLHEEETGCTDRKVVPAEAGTPLRDGHVHARALRIVVKAILKDLWIEGKRLVEVGA